MKSMITLVAVFLFMGVVRSFDLAFTEDVVICGGLLGLTREQSIEEAKTRGPNIGCIHACVIKKFDGIEDGKIVFEKLHAILDENKKAIDIYDTLKGGLTKCSEEIIPLGNSITECDAAKKLGDCMVPYFPKAA